MMTMISTSRRGSGSAPGCPDLLKQPNREGVRPPAAVIRHGPHRSRSHLHPAACPSASAQQQRAGAMSYSGVVCVI